MTVSVRRRTVEPEPPPEVLMVSLTRTASVPSRSRVPHRGARQVGRDRQVAACHDRLHHHRGLDGEVDEDGDGVAVQVVEAGDAHALAERARLTGAEPPAVGGEDVPVDVDAATPDAFAMVVLIAAIASALIDVRSSTARATRREPFSSRRTRA
ncbi:hypothetical protein [Streptomyces mirabilis]|uniref:hypothetical protein n=1 Tax=Streptomyces mirabilis TaxID=68239 RepID=UPI0036EE634A